MVTKKSAKIVLLGSGAVGKTSLVRRFVDSSFSEDYISTIGTVISKKEIETNSGNVKFLIWDIHGQKISSRLHSVNYAGAKGAIIVYDSTRAYTLNEVNEWIDGLYNVVGKVPLVVVGNKYDLLKEFSSSTGIEFTAVKKDGELKEKFDSWMRKNNFNIVNFFEKNYPEDFESLVFEPVSYWQLTKYIKNQLEKDYSIDISYFTSSAKTGENVETIFKTLAELILEGD